MPFSLMPALFACLLWCASIACAQGGRTSVPHGPDAWGKPAGESSLVLALSGHEPLRCAGKQRCIDPVWPQATVAMERLPMVRAVDEVWFSIRPATPELEHAAWVGVIELRV